MGIGERPGSVPVRLPVRLRLSRLDAGWAFFALFYACMLTAWYPQMQATYSDASRGADLAGPLLFVGVIAGVAVGSGALLDALVVAAASALGCAAAFGLGGAVVVELAELRPFYASGLDRHALEAALWSELVPAAAAAALGAVVGGVGATLVQARREPFGPRTSALGLVAAALAILAAAAIGAAAIGLVASRVATDASGPAIGPSGIRAAILAVGCVAAVSAVVQYRDHDGVRAVTVGLGRILLGVVLVAVPYLVAGIYRMFVLEPF